MDNFYFWKTWTTEYKSFFGLSVLLLLASMLFMISTSLFGFDFIQTGGSLEALTTLPIDFQKFTNHYHEFNIETINYLIYEKYTSSLIEFNPAFAILYNVLLFLGFALFLTFSTTLSKYLYYISVLVSLIFLATLNFDLLEIFTSNSKQILSVAVILIGGVSYAIYNFYYTLSLTKRFLIFLSIIIGLVGFSFIFSPLDSQVICFHFAGYSSASMIVLILFFVIYISIENSLFLLFLNSNNKNGSLIIYVLINFLYIGILVAKLFFYIDIYGFNEYTLIISATLFTVWGTLKRNSDNTLGDTVARVLIIMVLGGLTLSTIGFHTANQNSALIDGLRRVVFVCFLGYGGIFLLYVLVNFIGHVQAKVNVYKIVFQPTEFTVFRLYMIGGIACMTLFAYKYQKRPFYQAIGAYYNSIADLYYFKGEPDIAEPFYQIAKTNAPFNIKSNVLLANLSIKKQDYSKAIEYYDYATSSGGNEFSYIQLSNIYNQRGNYFDALFSLKEGLKKFPKSYKIWNNLGLLSKKSSLTDSTVHYFSKSIKYAPENDLIPTNNLITFLLKNDFNEESKKLIESIDDDKLDLKTKVAISAYNAKNGVFNQWNKVDFEVDSNLSSAELAYLYNHFINNLAKMDTNDLYVIDSSLNAPNNMFNYEPLTLLKGFYEFYNGDPVTAKEHLATLANGTSFYSGYYNNTLGMWLLMHENYELANKYLAIADKYNFQGGKFNHALNETILGNYVAADTIWAELGNSAKGYQNIVNNTIDSLNDFEKLVMLSLGNQKMYSSFIETCENEKITELMKLERVKYLLNQDEKESASAIINELKTSNNINLEIPLSLLEADLKVKNEDYNGAIKILSEHNYPLELNASFLNLSALTSEKLGDSLQAAKLYANVVKKYPFYEKGILNYTNFLQSKGNTSEAYNIVVKGVRALPNSIELLKTYTLICLDESLTNYAEESLLELKKLIPESEYIAFNKVYSEKSQKLEEKFNAWEE